MPDTPAINPSRRIVIASFGSLGDLHPFLALAEELRRRGHSVSIATAEWYGDRVRRLGFDFAPIGPPVSPEDPDLLQRIMRSARGPEYLFRKVFLPHLPQLYADLEKACEGADLLVAGDMVFIASTLAEKKGLPWAAILLSPISFLSSHDPSVLPPLHWMGATHGWPAALHRAFLQLPRMVFRRWSGPLHSFRSRLGLPTHPDALLSGKLRADRVIAMFSGVFAAPQPDWPRGTVQAGFAFFEQAASPEQEAVQAQMEAFIAAGAPPVVFTLGSAAVHAAGDFFHRSAEAVHRLQIRAILVVGKADFRVINEPNILVVPYADYMRVFPLAAAVVHQGGIGTTAEALRAGVPSLVVPFNFDQPDNAARMERLGAGIVLRRKKYNTRHAYYALLRLLRDGAMRDRAAALGRVIRAENGPAIASDAIEDLLAASNTSST